MSAFSAGNAEAPKSTTSVALAVSSQKQVLVRQHHTPEDDRKFIQALVPANYVERVIAQRGGLELPTATEGARGLELARLHVPDLSTQSRLVTNISVPNLVGLAVGSGGESESLHVLFSALLVAVVVVCCAHAWRTRSPFTAAGWASAALLVTLSWVLPWYVLWVLPLAALSSSRRLRAAALVLDAAGGAVQAGRPGGQVGAHLDLARPHRARPQQHDAGLRKLELSGFTHLRQSQLARVAFGRIVIELGRTDRQPFGFPALETAGYRSDLTISHALQGFCCEQGTHTAAAQGEDLAIAVGLLAFDAQFEESARQGQCADR